MIGIARLSRASLLAGAAVMSIAMLPPAQAEDVPSVQELYKLFKDQQRVMGEQQKQILEQQKRIQELERRAAKSETDIVRTRQSVKANTDAVKTTQREVEAADLVARGERQFAVLSQTAPAAQIQNGAPLAFHFVPQNVTSEYAAVILAKAPHPNAARLFVNFLLSDEHQQGVVEQLAGYGVVTAVKPPKGFPEPTTLDIYKADLAKILAERANLIAVLIERGLAPTLGAYPARDPQREPDGSASDQAKDEEQGEPRHPLRAENLKVAQL